MVLVGQEVAKHNSVHSCWVILHANAYDVTDFLAEHPGGSRIILKYAGKDATAEFDPIHPPDTLDKYLPASKHKGAVDMTTVTVEKKPASPDEESRLERVNNKPVLSQCYNLMDFEAVARNVMKKTAWGYYSSAADDEITLRENHAAYHRIWFRPRILVDVATISLATRMFHTPTAVPFYITATALGRLGHPDGECVLARAAAAHGVAQMIPTLASCSFDEIVDAATATDTTNNNISSIHTQSFLWFQLYVNRDREVTRKIVQHAEKRGCKALFITVDAPQLGRREKDMRSKFDEEASSVQQQQNNNNDDDDEVDRSQGAARAISSFIDPSLSWKDLAWFRSITSMPILLKGVQCVEDAIRAALDPNVDGIVLSNHGGRQLEFSPSAIELLAEVVPALASRGLDKKLDLFVDGGVRRGTDILKALCLGAKGVGIGRPFLYAMSAYGQEGVEKAIRLLKDELEMGMRLLGCTTVEELGPHLLDTKSLTLHGNGTPRDTLMREVYDGLAVASEKSKL